MLILPMKRTLLIVCVAAFGSVMSQAAGLQLGNGPRVEQGIRPLVLVSQVKATPGAAGAAFERVLSNPGPANGRVRVLSSEAGGGLPNGNGNGNSRPGVPEPEGWAAGLALGFAGLIFGGYRFKQRRLVCDAT
jgi:hypothetical protein